MADDVLQDQAFEDAGTEVPETGDSGAVSQPEGQEQVQEAVEQPQGEFEFLKGTPYKSPDELVRGYKEIQRLVSAKDQQISAARAQAQKAEQLARQVAMWARAQLGGQQKKVDPSEILAKFSANPRETFNQWFQETFQQVAPHIMGPLVKDLESIKTDSEVSRFISNHPEITAADEQAILDVLQERPWLARQPNRLEEALLVLQGKDPAAWAARRNQAKARIERSATDARQAAGVGGKTAAMKVAEGDEFDAVLKDDADLRRRFSRA